jgi:hypothetical protein
MRPAPAELGSPLAGAIQRFVAYKRALNRRYDTEEQDLRLLDRYLVERGDHRSRRRDAGRAQCFLGQPPPATAT